MLKKTYRETLEFVRSSLMLRDTLNQFAAAGEIRGFTRESLVEYVINKITEVLDGKD